ncbi:MAG TPA: glycosyltransferase family 39 protein [Candidatus Eremiobacteraceae bacterium]|nr:glycosyltransferase family 39 protein [Candidatus Eremiobacteraceae bacterium]
MNLPAIPRSVWWMVLLSFVLQVASIAAFHQYRMRPGEDNFGFGFEMGRVGRSIALGQGFSNPYGGNTGPSAWEPPLYPYLIGGVFKIFGVYSYTSAWVLLSINSLFASLTTIPVFLIAHRAFGSRVAIWSARVWALNPYVWYWSIHWIWDTTFTPLVLSLILLLSLEMEQRADWLGWVLFGALWAVGGLANPSMLAFLPFCGLWIWWRRYRRGLTSLGGVALSSFVFFLVLSPWLIRNYEIFGRFVFIRDDFGLQFRLGNNKFADGMLIATLQPNLNQPEFEKFKHMGELAYEADCRRLAFNWIREHPGRFAIISMKRLFYYWNGVPRPTDSLAPWDFRSSLFLASSVLAIWGLVRALRQKRPGAWLFAGLVLTYPTVYYFVFPHARYRHPIEPELFILAVFLLCEVRSGRAAEVSLIADC